MQSRSLCHCHHHNLHHYDYLGRCHCHHRSRVGGAESLLLRAPLPLHNSKNANRNANKRSSSVHRVSLHAFVLLLRGSLRLYLSRIAPITLSLVLPFTQRRSRSIGLRSYPISSVLTSTLIPPPLPRTRPSRKQEWVAIVLALHWLKTHTTPLTPSPPRSPLHARVLCHRHHTRRKVGSGTIIPIQSLASLAREALAVLVTLTRAPAIDRRPHFPSPLHHLLPLDCPPVRPRLGDKYRKFDPQLYIHTGTVILAHASIKRLMHPLPVVQHIQYREQQRWQRGRQKQIRKCVWSI